LQAFAAELGVKVVPHGLRKNAVNALLEAGCSAAETATISGQTLQMVEHYAKARSQKRLGEIAILKWQGGSAVRQKANWQTLENRSAESQFSGDFANQDFSSRATQLTIRIFCGCRASNLRNGPI
jgi:hypothetical protein